MNLDRSDLIQYLYVVGAIVTGVYLERTAASFGNLVVVSGVLVAGVVWLQYYKLSIVPRLEHVTTSEDE